MPVVAETHQFANVPCRRLRVRPMSLMGPDRVKTRTPGRKFMNFSRFSAFSAITGPAERKNSLQMRRFQTISEFSHGLGPGRAKTAGREVSCRAAVGVCGFDRESSMLQPL